MSRSSGRNLRGTLDGPWLSASRPHGAGRQRAAITAPSHVHAARARPAVSISEVPRAQASLPDPDTLSSHSVPAPLAIPVHPPGHLCGRRCAHAVALMMATHSPATSLFRYDCPRLTSDTESSPLEKKKRERNSGKKKKRGFFQGYFFLVKISKGRYHVLVGCSKM